LLTEYERELLQKKMKKKPTDESISEEMANMNKGEKNKKGAAAKAMEKAVTPDKRKKHIYSTGVF
jgi:hypothetical protein